MEGRARAAKREAELAMSQAWHTEAFARMKGDDFKGALDRIFKPKLREQTPDEMLAVLQDFANRGAPLRFTQIN